MQDIEISVVVPMYNESDNINYFFQRVVTVLEKSGCHYEIICINDGSRDDTLTHLLRHHDQNSAIKVLDLSRNFGKETALSAGLDYAQGRAVIPIDADLQDPPELIHDLIAKWREGYDVVYATRRERQGETFLKKFTAKMFYHTIDQLSEVEIPKNTGDFRLLDRKVVDALKQFPEKNRFMKGLFAWVGYEQTAIYYDRDPRLAGSSKWNYWRLWNFALDGITSFSSVPLRIWTYVGLFISAFALLYALQIIIQVIIYGRDAPGYASIMVTLLFVSGLQFITLGIIGEYLGRIFNEVKQRPLYLVRQFYTDD
jgi:glycosyltransferase involved in cell wall biosynthesis